MAQPAAPAPYSVGTITQPQTPLNISAPSIAPISQLPAVSTPATPATTPAPTSTPTGLESIAAQLAGKTLDSAAIKANTKAPAQKALNAYDTQLALHQQASLARQEAALKSGETLGFASREAQNIQRTDAIEGLRLSALRAGAAGDLAQAEVDAQALIDTKYGQLEVDLQTARSNIINNWDTLSPADKKRAQATLLQLDKDDAFVKEQKENEAAVNQVLLKAIEFGADQSIISKIQKATSASEAIRIAGPALQNPKAKLEIELLKQEIAFKRKQASLLGEPTAAEAKETAAKLKEAQAAIPVMQDKIAAVDTLSKHPGLNSRVGSTGLSRAPRTALGTGLRALSIVGLPSVIGGLVDTVSGAGQDFAGGVHKLTGGLTLDNLIAAKARGATFGALSEGELGILAASATTLNDWEIKDGNGKGTGFWNIDEASFNKELNTIKTLTQRALAQSGQNLLTPDEQAIIDALDDVGFSPSF